MNSRRPRRPRRPRETRPQFMDLAPERPQFVDLPETEPEVSPVQEAEDFYGGTEIPTVAEETQEMLRADPRTPDPRGMRRARQPMAGDVSERGPDPSRDVYGPLTDAPMTALKTLGTGIETLATGGYAGLKLGAFKAGTGQVAETRAAFDNFMQAIASTEGGFNEKVSAANQAAQEVLEPPKYMIGALELVTEELLLLGAYGKGKLLYKAGRELTEFTIKNVDRLDALGPTGQKGLLELGSMLGFTLKVMGRGMQQPILLENYLGEKAIKGVAVGAKGLGRATRRIVSGLGQAYEAAVDPGVGSIVANAAEARTRRIDGEPPSRVTPKVGDDTYGINPMEIDGRPPGERDAVLLARSEASADTAMRREFGYEQERITGASTRQDLEDIDRMTPFLERGDVQFEERRADAAAGYTERDIPFLERSSLQESNWMKRSRHDTTVQITDEHTPVAAVNFIMRHAKAVFDENKQRFSKLYAGGQLPGYGNPLWETMRKTVDKVISDVWDYSDIDLRTGTAKVRLEYRNSMGGYLDSDLDPYAGPTTLQMFTLIRTALKRDVLEFIKKEQAKGFERIATSRLKVGKELTPRAEARRAEIGRLGAQPFSRETIEAMGDVPSGEALNAAMNKEAEEIVDLLLGTKEMLPKWGKYVEVRNEFNESQLYRMNEDGILIAVSRPKQEFIPGHLDPKGVVDPIDLQNILDMYGLEEILKDAGPIDDFLSDITGHPLREMEPVLSPTQEFVERQAGEEFLESLENDQKLRMQFALGAKNPALTPERGKTAILEQLTRVHGESLLNDEAFDLAKEFVEGLPDDLLSDLIMDLRATLPAHLAGDTLGTFKPPWSDVTSGSEFYNSNPLIQILLTNIRGGDPDNRTVVHEMSHYLERYMPEEWMNALAKEFQRDVAENGRQVMREYATSHQLHKAGLITEEQFSAAHHRAYRYASWGGDAPETGETILPQFWTFLDPLGRRATDAEGKPLGDAVEMQWGAYLAARSSGFHEWFAETLADRAIAQKTLREASQEARNAIQYGLYLIRRLLIELNNFFAKKGRHSVTGKFLEGLQSGKIGVNNRRPFIFSLDHSISREDYATAPIINLRLWQKINGGPIDANMEWNNPLGFIGDEELSDAARLLWRERQKGIIQAQNDYVSGWSLGIEELRRLGYAEDSYEMQAANMVYRANNPEVAYKMKLEEEALEAALDDRYAAIEANFRRIREATGTGDIRRQRVMLRQLKDLLGQAEAADTGAPEIDLIVDQIRDVLDQMKATHEYPGANARVADEELLEPFADGVDMYEKQNLISRVLQIDTLSTMFPGENYVHIGDAMADERWVDPQSMIEYIDRMNARMEDYLKAYQGNEQRVRKAAVSRVRKMTKDIVATARKTPGVSPAHLIISRFAGAPERLKTALQRRRRGAPDELNSFGADFENADELPKNSAFERRFIETSIRTQLAEKTDLGATLDAPFMSDEALRRSGIDREELLNTAPPEMFNENGEFDPFRDDAEYFDADGNPIPTYVAFSRWRGYTEEEIAEFGRMIAMVDEGYARGYDESELVEMSMSSKWLDYFGEEDALHIADIYNVRDLMETYGLLPFTDELSRIGGGFSAEWVLNEGLLENVDPNDLAGTGLIPDETIDDLWGAEEFDLKRGRPKRRAKRLLRQEERQARELKLAEKIPSRPQRRKAAKQGTRKERIAKKYEAARERNKLNTAASPGKGNKGGSTAAARKAAENATEAVKVRDTRYQDTDPPSVESEPVGTKRVPTGRIETARQMADKRHAKDERAKQRELAKKVNEEKKRQAETPSTETSFNEEFFVESGMFIKLEPGDKFGFLRRKRMAPATDPTSLALDIDPDVMLQPFTGIAPATYSPTDVKFSDEVEGFSQALEALLTGPNAYDRTLLDHALDDNGIGKSFIGRFANMFNIKRLTDPMTRKSDTLKDIQISATRDYTSGQTVVLATVADATQKLAEAFGGAGTDIAEDAISGKVVRAAGVFYRHAYFTKAGKKRYKWYTFNDQGVPVDKNGVAALIDADLAPHVGSIFDMINRRSEYRLTQLQHRALINLQRRFYLDLRKTIDSGATLDQLKDRLESYDAYIPFKWKNSAMQIQHRQMFGGAKTPSGLRRRTSENVIDFYRSAGRANHEIEKDIRTLMLERLSSFHDLRMKHTLAAKIIRHANPENNILVPGRLLGHMDGPKLRYQKGVLSPEAKNVMDDEVIVRVGQRVWGVPRNMLDTWDEFMTGLVGMRKTDMAPGSRERVIITDPDSPRYGEMETPGDVAARLKPNVTGERQQVSDWVDEAKGILLNFDLSILGGRQGLILLSKDPMQWVKSQRDALRMFDRPEHTNLWLQQNLQGMVYGQQAGLQLSQSGEGLFFDIPGLTQKYNPAIHGAGAEAEKKWYQRQRKLIVERIPGLKHVNERQFQAVLLKGKYGVYESALSNLMMMREFGTEVNSVLEMFPILGGLSKRLRGVGKTDFELREIAADFANNLLGGIEWARITAQPRGRAAKVLVLTEGWTRSRLGRLINIPKMTPKGMLARRAFLQEVAVMNMIGITLAMAFTGTKEVITNRDFFDPTHRDFNVVKIGDRRIRITPYSAEYRAIARFFMGSEDDDFRRAITWSQTVDEASLNLPGGSAPEAVYKALGLKNNEISAGEAWRRINFGLQFIEDRSGQLVTIGREQISGRTRMGEPVASGEGASHVAQRMAHVLDNLLPLMSQNLMGRLTEAAGLDATGKDPRPWLSVAGDWPTEIMGFSTWEEPLRESLLEEAERVLGSRPEAWMDLEPVLRDKVLMDEETRPIYRQKAQKDQRERMEVRWKAYDEQLRDDEYLNSALKPLGDGRYELFSPHEWTKALLRRKGDVFARIDIMSETLDMENYIPTDRQQELMKQFYAISDSTAVLNPETNEFDADRYFRARANFLDKLEGADGEGRDDRLFVERNSVRYATPMVKLYYRDRKIIDQYYSIGTIGAIHASQYSAEIQADWDRMQQGVPLDDILTQYPIDQHETIADTLRQLKRDQRELRDHFRTNNPLADAAMVRWQELKPLTTLGEAVRNMRSAAIAKILPKLAA